MHWGNSGPSSSSARRRWAFRPVNEGLEGRVLLATIDLGPVANNAAATHPYGVQMIGTTGSGAGYTVTDVGDTIKFSGYDDYVIGAPGLTAPSIDGDPTFTGTSTVYLIFGSQSVNSRPPPRTLATSP